MENNENSSPADAPEVTAIQEALLKGLQDQKSPIYKAVSVLVSDTITDDVAEQVEEALDINDLADRVKDAMDLDEVVDEKVAEYVENSVDWQERFNDCIDYDEIADNLDASAIAEEVVDHLDHSEIASHIDTSDLDIDIDTDEIVEQVQQNLDTDEIVGQVMEEFDLEEALTEVLQRGEYLIINKDSDEYRVAMDRLKDSGVEQASQLFVKAVITALRETAKEPVNS